jgi:hypothetical protein
MVTIKKMGLLVFDLCKSKKAPEFSGAFFYVEGKGRCRLIWDDYMIISYDVRKKHHALQKTASRK